MKIIATVTYDNYHYQEIAKITHTTIEAYAKKIGAKFVVLPNYNISQLADYDYERIIFVHSDIIIRPDTPSLFEVVPKGWIGAYNYGQHVSSDLTAFASTKNLPEPKPWSNRWYSSGVVVVDADHIDHLFNITSEEDFNYYLNHTDHDHILDIGPRFNRMPYFDQFSNHYQRFEFYIIHYSQLIQQIDVENLKHIIQEDLKIWESLKEKDYHIPRPIIVNMGGGLGDQICAEPIVRELRRLHPYDYLLIKSHWPELWDNLKDYKIDGIVPKDVTEYPAETLQYYTYCGPDISMQMGGMTHSNMSSTELTSYLALNRPLPPEKREIRLDSTQAITEAMQEKLNCTLEWLNSAIVMHPGLTWPTRTLAVIVWLELIQLLLNENNHIVIIGQGGPYQGPGRPEKIGVLDFSVPDNKNIIDARNKLTVSETLAVLKHSRVLISNDSSPIHLAGATDIWILGVFTTKHPHFVLPYRRGTPWYKAIAINNKPDCWPCGVNALRAFPEGLRVDLCKNYNNPYCCHPNAKQILKSLKEDVL